MTAIRELFSGLFTAIASGVIVLAAISLAAAEGMNTVSSAPTATGTPPVQQDTSRQGQAVMGTPTPINAFSATPAPPTPTSCPFPAGWVPYIIQSGDTVEALAAANGIKADKLESANCLWTGSLPPGSVLYLPPPALTATPTQTETPSPFVPSPNSIYATTAVPCGAPYGWVRYVVKSGETLFQLSRRFGVSVYQLQAANCLGGSDYIQAGQVLYAPNVPAVWPTSTFTAAPTRTKTPVTPKPTTAVPTTAVPTTAVPTTAVPTTAVPPTEIIPPTDAPTAAATAAPTAPPGSQG